MKIGNWFEIGDESIMTISVVFGLLIVCSLIIAGVTHYNITEVLHRCG